MPVPRPWWSTGSGAARLAHDREIVAAEQAGLRYVEHEGELWLIGSFVIRTASGIPDTVRTAIRFRPTYPATEPIAAVLDDQFKPRSADRHFADEAYCCLWLDAATPWDPSDPDALRPLLDQLAIFYERQFIYDQTGVWAGPEWAHDGVAYVDYLLLEWALTPEELIALKPAIAGNVGWQSRCPCGSGRKYSRCHQMKVDGFLERGSKRMIEDLRLRLDEAARVGRLDRVAPPADLVGPQMKLGDVPVVEPPPASEREDLATG